MDRKDIKGVMSNQGKGRLASIADWNDWLSELRISGKNTIRVEIFFVVETGMRMKDLVDIDRNEYIHESIWIEEKCTRQEHTNRVGFLTGPIIDNANLMCYDILAKHFGKIEDSEVEIKKNIVFKEKEREWCLTVHSVRSVMDKVDYGL